MFPADHLSKEKLFLCQSHSLLPALDHILSVLLPVFFTQEVILNFSLGSEISEEQEIIFNDNKNSD